MRSNYEERKDIRGFSYWVIPKNVNKGFHHNCYIREIKFNKYSMFAQHNHFCGYIEIEPNSPIYTCDYTTLTHIDVHGGLTFSDFHEVFDESKTKWYLGFDCNHWCDQKDPKSFEYVLKELVNLSKQLKEVETTREE